MEFNKTVSVTKPEMFFEVSSGEEVLVAEVAEVRLNPYIVSRRAQNHVITSHLAASFERLDLIDFTAKIFLLMSMPDDFFYKE